MAREARGSIAWTRPPNCQAGKPEGHSGAEKQLRLKRLLLDYVSQRCPTVELMVVPPFVGCWRQFEFQGMRCLRSRRVYQRQQDETLRRKVRCRTSDSGLN